VGGALRIAACASVIALGASEAVVVPSGAGADYPLGLAVAPTNGDPLSGARFFVDHESEAAVAARSYPQLRVIADQPGVARFGAFSGSDVGRVVQDYLVRAARQEPGTVPMLATYRIVDGHCGNWTPTPADWHSYHAFISRFAHGIGRYRAVLFLEMDALITTPCLSSQGLVVRMRELHDAIHVLTRICPHLVIYLDGGAADALSASRTARLLRWAGVARIQGFFLNSTHFDWTSNEIRYGERVSRLTGGKHFVVNTGENGRGPLVPANRVRRGNEVLCNPANRGLGPKPTTSTGYPNVDAFAWTSNPGESGGACVPGAPHTGTFWPAYALMLVRNAQFAVDSHTSPRQNSSDHTHCRRARRHAAKSHCAHRLHRGARHHRRG
jgi:endoglucanase